MSDYTAISGASATLQAVLKAGITDSAEPQLSGVPIHLLSPKEMRDSADKKTGVSLWLYRVTRNGDTLNVPPKRVAPNQITHRSLPIDLYYLVTPIATKPEDEQDLLGRVIQIFNDHSILRGALLKGSLQGAPIEFRLTLEMLTLEELTRVWQALMEPYQLSLCYMAQLVTIDSALEPMQSSPVLVKEAEYVQIVA